MRELFDTDGKVMRFLSMFTDVFYLSVLWIVCSLPIITFGASTAAYYSVMMKLVVGEESYITRSFFKAFRENFKIATIVWIILGIVGTLIGTSIYIVNFAGEMGNAFFYTKPFYIFTLIMYCMTFNFVFPYIAKFYDTVGRTLYISLIFAVRYLIHSVIVIAVDVIIVLLAFQIPVLFFLLPMLSGFCHGTVYRRVFDKLIDTKQEEKEPDEEQHNQE